jgi:hypothetical protein
VKEWTALQGGAYMVAAKLAFFFIKKNEESCQKVSTQQGKAKRKKNTRTTFSDWHFPGAR